MPNNSKKVLIIFILFLLYLNSNVEIVENKNLIRKEPKISVVIPIYNGGKFLNQSLKTVQNQKFKDIEIIIIDDNSNDNSLEIIKRYIRNDKRIKLIKNKNNRRILFCKSFGALNSKGEYIFELDQDDKIINDNAFDILYNESKEFELDLLHFDNFKGRNITNYPKIYISFENENIDVQPKLKFNQFKKHLYLVWGNMIKSDLYKKVIILIQKIFRLYLIMSIP